MSTVLHNFETRQRSHAHLFEEKLKSEGMHFELANLYRSQGNYVSAVMEIKALLSKAPNFSYKLALADTYIEGQSYEHALIHVDELLRFTSYDKSILYVINLLKIECLIQLSKVSEAIDQINQQVHFCDDDELMAWKAVAYMKLNDFDHALSFYQKSINKNSDNEKSWLGIGSIHCIKGDYDLGLSCFKRVLDINTENIAAKSLLEKFSINYGDLNG